MTIKEEKVGGGGGGGGVGVGWVFYIETGGHATSDDIFHELSLRRVDGMLGEKRIGIPHQPAPWNRRMSGHGHLHPRRRCAAERVNVWPALPYVLAPPYG